MARSLFRLLHGLYETRRTGAALLELVNPKRQQLYNDRLLPGALNGDALAACETLPQFRVAVVGGGFAGLMAAWYLRQCGVGVTVFEATGRVGGRVLTDYNLIAGKYVEAGAELIGTNHPMWIELTNILGPSLIEITGEEWYERAGQKVRLRFGDRDLTDVERKQLKTGRRLQHHRAGREGESTRSGRGTRRTPTPTTGCRSLSAWTRSSAPRPA